MTGSDIFDIPILHVIAPYVNARTNPIGVVVQCLPDDPLPDTNYLNGASAPAHVGARQAQLYGDPYPHPQQCSTSPSPRAFPPCDMHAAHGHMHPNRQLHWEHGSWYGENGPGGAGLRGGVEGRLRPQSARPGGGNREGPPATAEAVHVASQVW